MNPRIFIVAIWGTLLFAVGTSAQPSRDCSRFDPPLGQAICGNAELAAADNRMAAAYAALEKSLPRDEQPLLLDDQRGWLDRGGAECVTESKSEMVQCLVDQTERRRRFFIGEGPNDAAGAPRLLPRFYAETGPYQITIIYPQVSGVAPSITEAFDKAVRNRTFDALWIKDFGEGEENIRYEVAHLDARLAVIVFVNWASGGGAHGFGGRSSLLFDWKQGRELKLADILSDPHAAVSAIAAQCKPRLEREAAALRRKLDADADPTPTIGDVKRWAPDNAGVDILFDPYVVGGNFALRCRLVYSELAQWLKPGGPLPPQS